ncbi:blue copper protein 1a-like [Vicia villosa]|uniref:blue copper protein 1a-like n=1 Tax=Vicia villosa TaxID=3911 RepID=UPI00273A9390|nr:blue copper protein 1a-like [Vicia villosa]
MTCSNVMYFAICMVLFSSVAMAVDHIVGDEKGWTVDFNYTQWAQDKVFRVGDNLVFNYDNSKHNVFKVNGALFQNCDFPPQNEALSTGKDVIQLKTDGRKWYICGKANHCAARQMKLVINVLEEGAPSPSSSAHSLASTVFGVLMLAMIAITAIF